MRDGIIKGTGDSRYLKTVADALKRYPTHELMLQAMVEGKFPIDLNGINPSGWNQQGTPLNKNSLLKDSTASLWGLGSGATPDDALVWLKNLILASESDALYQACASMGTYGGTTTFITPYITTSGILGGDSSSPIENTLTINIPFSSLPSFAKICRFSMFNVTFSHEGSSGQAIYSYSAIVKINNTTIDFKFDTTSNITGIDYTSLARFNIAAKLGRALTNKDILSVVIISRRTIGNGYELLKAFPAASVSYM